MIPAIPEGPFAVADQHGLGVEAALDVVERRHLLALRRGADGQRAAGDLVEVEGVQRLRGQQHHVVGDVDDVVDRPLAGGASSRACSQGGEGADRDVGEDAGGEARAELGDLDRDRGVVGRPRPRPRPARPRPTARRPSGAPLIAWTSRATP